MGRWSLVPLQHCSDGIWPKPKIISVRTIPLLAPDLSIPECAYVLRFVELNNRGEQNPWSLRQSLVFQRVSTSSIWVFIALSNGMRRELQPYLSRSAGLSRDPFNIHLILMSVAAATWRAYLVYIAEEVRELVWRNLSFVIPAD